MWRWRLRKKLKRHESKRVRENMALTDSEKSDVTLTEKYKCILITSICRKQVTNNKANSISDNIALAAAETVPLTLQQQYQ